ncbi:MAG: metallophosphoesterase [Nanobdellota archaeon]
MEFRDLCLYIKKYDTLVFSDVHMGYEEALNKQGIFLPREQFNLTIKRLDENIKNHKRIIINGDIKHEFGQISETEWRHTLRLIDFLAKKCTELILIKGNHDTILGPIAQRRNIKVFDSFKLGNILFTHGHKLAQESAETIVIGHEHPAVTLVDHPRSEKFKCFLKGKWQEKELIVLPSFNLINEGTDILKEKTLSPYLKDIDEFEVSIIGKKVLDFGAVKDLKKFSRA